VTKLMTVLAAALFAATALLGSGAEAGFNVHMNAPAALSMIQKTGCHGGGFRVYQRRYHVVHRSVRPKVQVARIHRVDPVTVAKVEEPKVEDQKVEDTVAPAVDTEAPAVDTTKTDDTAAATTDDTTQKTADTGAEVKSPDTDTKKVATKATDCKAFFPAINKALTVPCN
jgi:hypothetical protein